MAGSGVSNVISRQLRERRQRILDDWENSVAALPGLQKLERAVLVDHLPEFLEGLAKWVDGDTAAARSAFGLLADGHAVQRLSFGVDLATLTREYALLRSALFRECLAVPSTEGTAEALLRLNEGMDEAISEAVRRYTVARDHIRDRFIAILAHDLRSPLSTIALSGGYIVSASSGLADVLYKHATIITRSAEKMERMIHDLMEFARGHLGGGIPVELRSANLGEICQEVVEELRASHRDRDLSIQCSGDLGGYWDHDRTQQALSNLIVNALEHGADPVRVMVAEAADRRSIETTVTNRGRAIPQQELATLFDPFRLASRSGTTGLGLGLFIAHAVALAHGARFEVQSSEAEGTRFSIVWPRMTGAGDRSDAAMGASDTAEARAKP